MIRFLRDFLRVASLPCAGYTELLSREIDAPLSAGERAGVRIHVSYCRGCARFRAHIRQLRELLRTADIELSAGLNMPDAVRTRVRALLAERSKEKPESL